MEDRSVHVGDEMRLGRRTARHLIEAEAYRRVLAGNLPSTLPEFAEQLTAWLRATYPTASTLSSSEAEDAIQETWHRRHDIIGSEL